MFLKVLSNIAIGLFVLIVGLLLVSSFSIPGIPFDTRVVITGSMEPAIKTGSVVFIRPVELYAEGDIITFRRANSQIEEPITHRIVSVEAVEGEYLYTTKGDANDAEDTNPVLYDEVFGKVQFHVPWVGYALDVAKKPIGFTILIILPLLLIIFEEVKKIRRELKKDDENKE
jgi:signal peptidase